MMGRGGPPPGEFQRPFHSFFLTPSVFLLLPSPAQHERSGKKTVWWSPPKAALCSPLLTFLAAVRALALLTCTGRNCVRSCVAIFCCDLSVFFYALRSAIFCVLFYAAGCFPCSIMLFIFRHTLPRRSCNRPYSSRNRRARLRVCVCVCCVCATHCVCPLCLALFVHVVYVSCVCVEYVSLLWMCLLCSCLCCVYMCFPPSLP